MLIKIIIPPIVGVPAFLIIWFTGPSERIGCPIGWNDDNFLIIISPNIKEKKSEVKIAAPVRKVI